MNEKLSISSYLFVGSMLFGMFFGAGNLIFPVHMGQEAGAQLLPATAVGFLITAIGLPFLGIVAIIGQQRILPVWPAAVASSMQSL